MLMEGNTAGENCVGKKKLEYINHIFMDVGCSRYAEIRKSSQNPTFSRILCPSLRTNVSYFSQN